MQWPASGAAPSAPEGRHQLRLVLLKEARPRLQGVARRCKLGDERQLRPTQEAISLPLEGARQPGMQASHPAGHHPRLVAIEVL